MEFEGILFERNGSVATVTFNRPDRLNALTYPMLESIGNACEVINSDESIRVAIFTGAGRGFCSGIDLKERDLSDPTRDRMARIPDIKPAYRPIGKILEIDKPTIAAVNGVAVGGGLALALECDIRIASDTARFSAIYSKIGMPQLDGVSQLLPAAVGLSRALELMYTANIIDAHEADRIGLVSRVVPQDELLDQTMALAQQIANGPPVAIRLTKNATIATHRRAYWDNAPRAAYATLLNNSLASHDIREGGRAFAEKRDARFTGLEAAD